MAWLGVGGGGPGGLGKATYSPGKAKDSQASKGQSGKAKDSQAKQRTVSQAKQRTVRQSKGQSGKQRTVVRQSTGQAANLLCRHKNLLCRHKRFPV